LIRRLKNQRTLGIKIRSKTAQPDITSNNKKTHIDMVIWLVITATSAESLLFLFH